MLNNKGQSLVLFVLLLPIMLGIMALVIDVGNVFVKKNHIDNVIMMVMDVTLDKDLKQDEVEKMLEYNSVDDVYGVKFEGDKVVIHGNAHVKGIFSKVLGFSIFYVESEYVGEVLDGKKIIDKRR